MKGLSNYEKILLTGGGSAGHVTPNIALFPSLKKLGYEIQYIGSYDGIEKKLIEELGIPYTGISSGKLRRYMSAKILVTHFVLLKAMAKLKDLLKNISLILFFQRVDLSAYPLY